MAEQDMNATVYGMERGRADPRRIAVVMEPRHISRSDVLRYDVQHSTRLAAQGSYREKRSGAL